MTKSLEDYVEAIYRLSQDSGRARVVEVAAMLHVKMPSVNNAVKELARLKLVKYEKYRELMLTEEGEAVARKVYEHHLLLKGFLLSLGVSEENAENDACAMEHILSEETIACFRRATGARAGEGERRLPDGGIFFRIRRSEDPAVEIFREKGQRRVKMINFAVE